MVTVDVKDRKILYQLDVNSRQSFRSIGRKVGLSKDAVFRRIKRLQEEGIIIRFITLFDYLRLGGPAIEEIAVEDVEVDATEEELYNDWNEKVDKFGRIKKDESQEQK